MSGNGYHRSFRKFPKSAALIHKTLSVMAEMAVRVGMTTINQANPGSIPIPGRVKARSVALAPCQVGDGF